MAVILPFLLGFIGGAAFTVFTVLFLFLKGQRMLENLANKKETEMMSRIAALEEKDNSVPSSKVQAICKMARFDDDIMGAATPVRVVLFGNTLCVYRFDTRPKTPTKEGKNWCGSGSGKSGDDGGSDDNEDATTVIVSETLIGKINASTVISHSEKLSKFHRHTDPTERYAPLRGKCLVLRRKGNLPLFVEDPLLQMLRQQTRQQEEQDGKGGRHHHHHHHRLHHHRHGDQKRNPLFDRTFSLVSTLVDDHNEDESYFGADKSEDCFSSWTAVVFKFPTRRELERWFNLLQATPQSDEWRGFIKRLPQLDVFNLVVARLFFENTRTGELRDLLVGKLRRKLSKVSRRLPKHMQGEILLDRVELGGEIPLITNVSDPSVATSGEIGLDFDLLYRGGLTLSLRFSITYRSVRVPDILFNVKMLEMANRMRLSVGSPPSNKLWVGSFHPPQLRMEFTQEVASHDGLLHAVLNLMPDMSKLMTTVVKVKLFEDMILPSMDDFPLPCLSYSPPSSEPNSPVTGDAEERSLKTPDSHETRKGDKKNPDSLASCTSSKTSEQATEKTVTTIKLHNGVAEDVEATRTTMATVPASPHDPKGQRVSFDVGDVDETLSEASSRFSSRTRPSSSGGEPWRQMVASRTSKLVKWMKGEARGLSEKGKKE